MATRMLSVILVVAATMAGCTPPGDKITEIEKGWNGVKVETKSGDEYYFRHGIDLVCEKDERLWECAKHSDLLIERK